MKMMTDRMLNIVLFGAPGAGKGTQAELLKMHYGLTHFSTGDMLRSESAAGTPLGRSIQSMIDNGLFVSDQIVMQLVSMKIAENMTAQGFIFDGVPRTPLQARMLDDMLHAKKMNIAAAILLEADEQELIERMLARGKMSGRADDHNESVIRNRIRTYHEKTESLIDYYRRQNNLYSIHGMGKVEDIFACICHAIDSL
jgi:adenylate kinase